MILDCYLVVFGGSWWFLVNLVNSWWFLRVFVCSFVGSL